MKNIGLFDMERKFHRLSNGRFATREMAYAEHQNTENKRLRFELEKYKRMYLAIVKDNQRLRRLLYDKNKGTND